MACDSPSLRFPRRLLVVWRQTPTSRLEENIYLAFSYPERQNRTTQRYMRYSDGWIWIRGWNILCTNERIQSSPNTVRIISDNWPQQSRCNQIGKYTLDKDKSLCKPFVSFYLIASVYDLTKGEDNKIFKMTMSSETIHYLPKIILSTSQMIL